MTRIELSDYTIQVGEIWPFLRELLAQRQYSRVVILVDENTRQYCLPQLLAEAGLSDPLILEISAGEIHKNIETCSQIWSQMMAADLGRKALLINLGGGVIGDMGGFCASTFKRGIHFLQIPTTLLSQVDASIGGKLGIDFAQVKNSVGLFCNPQAVLIDPAFLTTLSARELRSGFAEVIKHSLIADREQWEEQKQFASLVDQDWATILPASLQIKKAVVERDPFEENIRKALNFGHTIGHAVESVALESEKPFLHGEAIAIGMICEAYLSSRIAGLSPSALDEIKAVILRIYGHHPQKQEHYADFLRLMRNDKKNVGSRINFTMLKSPGEALINQTCEEELILESLNFYNQA